MSTPKQPELVKTMFTVKKSLYATDIRGCACPGRSLAASHKRPAHDVVGVDAHRDAG